MEINLKKRKFDRFDPTKLEIKGGPVTVNRMGVKVSSTTVAMTGGGSTVTATGARLAKKFILGITAKVVTAVAGASLTTINIGDGTDADRYGAAISKDLGTKVDYSNATADPREWLAAAGNVVFTAVAGVFSSGSIQLDVHYIDLESPE